MSNRIFFSNEDKIRVNEDGNVVKYKTLQENKKIYEVDSSGSKTLIYSETEKHIISHISFSENKAVKSICFNKDYSEFNCEFIPYFDRKVGFRNTRLKKCLNEIFVGKELEILCRNKEDEVKLTKTKDGYRLFINSDWVNILEHKMAIETCVNNQIYRSLILESFDCNNLLSIKLNQNSIANDVINRLQVLDPQQIGKVRIIELKTALKRMLKKIE